MPHCTTESHCHIHHPLRTNNISERHLTTMLWNHLLFMLCNPQINQSEGVSITTMKTSSNDNLTEPFSHMPNAKPHKESTHQTNQWHRWLTAPVVNVRQMSATWSGLRNRHIFSWSLFLSISMAHSIPFHFIFIGQFIFISVYQLYHSIPASTTI